MLGFIRRSLVAKLALLLVVAIVTGFSLSALISIELQVRTMERLNMRAAESLASGLAASVRSSMLSGNGLVVRQLLQQTQADLHGVTVRVFAPTGEEVFGTRADPKPGNAPHVSEVLRTQQVVDLEGGRRALPIRNAKRCRRCHELGELRGVLTVGTEGARVALDGGDASLFAFTAIARSAFVQIMTARKEQKLDEYIKELTDKSDVIEGMVVYSADGVPSYGDEKLPVSIELLAQALHPGPPFVTRVGERELVVQPLPNEPVCHGCHDKDAEMRGAMFVAMDRKAMRGVESLLQVSCASLEHVMLAGLGRLLNRFLDAQAESGLLTTLTLHDDKGRMFHDVSARPAPPAPVAKALAEASTVRMASSQDQKAELVYVMPLLNDESCQRCHGTDRKLRGAIEVVMDTSQEIAERKELQRLSALFAALTVVTVFLGLYMGLARTVLRPVGQLGDVAQRVGEGHLDVRAEVGSSDEMGRLALRLNEMIVGLKHKLELSKFVSQETMRHVSAQEGTVSRSGERKRMTVLFSDVRGFTAYSETRQPEEVVAMLNDFLHVQAELVVRHGGDIDKFVGDELMALFSGPEMELRATRCAVEMVEAVDARSHAIAAAAGQVAPDIRIGVGINTGEMVIGAMGAENRLDFTVIGDAVNLGARLCSAAAPGQVLLSEGTRGGLSNAAGLSLAPLAPIAVKGKKEPIQIYGASRGSA